jgi:hypothetical protein
MNEEEFKTNYGHLGQKAKISARCSCGQERIIYKEKAQENIIKHNGFYTCRSCSMKKSHCDNPRGQETKNKQRQGRLGRKHTEISKRKMSDSANEKWKTEWGRKQKKILAKKTAQQNSNVNLDKSKRKILYISAKNNGQIRVCNSSAEFIACEDILENDNNVISYETQVYYEINGRCRSLDFLIVYKDGTKKAVETKPKKRLTEPENVLQIQDSMSYAELNKWKFEVWTEVELNINSWKNATTRADEYRKKHYDIDYGAYRRNLNIKKSKRHYDTKIATDTVEVYCEWCKKIHDPLRLTYEKNIDRNGRYICEREGGYISGSKPKPHLVKENPYAAEGKKQCKKCEEIKLFEEFSPDNSKRDGYCSMCKPCRTAKMKAAYDKKKNK